MLLKILKGKKVAIWLVKLDDIIDKQTNLSIVTKLRKAKHQSIYKCTQPFLPVLLSTPKQAEGVCNKVIVSGILNEVTNHFVIFYVVLRYSYQNILRNPWFYFHLTLGTCFSLILAYQKHIRYEFKINFSNLIVVKFSQQLNQ